MSITAMKQAVEALENSVDLVQHEYTDAVELYGKYPTRAAKIDGLLALQKAHEDSITALRQAIEVAGKAEPVAHTLVAGALFDFMGYLTSRTERIVLSASDDAAPAVDAIRDFAKKRGLSLDDALVREWIDALPTAPAQPAVSVDELAKEYTKELDKLSQRNYELRMLNAGLTDALRLFVASAYPVDTAINSRGYNWSEAYLDQALQVATETAPAQQPLTEQQIINLMPERISAQHDGDLMVFARAIEAHIKGASLPR